MRSSRPSRARKRRARIAARIRSRRVSSCASGVMRACASRMPGRRPSAASASVASVALSKAARASSSSSTVKPAGTFASKGNMCRSRSQSACSVSILRPPGVSTERAKSRRLSSSWARLVGLPVRRSKSSASAASSSVTQRPSRSKTRIAMLAAAALVKVRQRMRPGGVPERRSRTTRSVSTLVLPAPALAETQAETSGSAARRWRSCVSGSTLKGGLLKPRPPPQATIRAPARGGRSRRHNARISGRAARRRPPCRS